MHDIKYIRDNFDVFKKKISKRNNKTQLDDILNLDQQNRKLIQEKETLEKQKKEISKSNENIIAFPLDVTDNEKCKSVFSQVKEKLGEVDISVFCTGIHDPKSEKTLNLEKVRKIMEVNFFGTVNSINAVYEYYRSKKAGQISIVSSVAGYRGLPAAGAYCASKSALSSFAESLYFDLKRSNVRVSLVSPGFIKTPMTDQNDFPMPMIKSPEFAAEQMFKGLTKSKGFEIHFPKSVSYTHLRAHET